MIEISLANVLVDNVTLAESLHKLEEFVASKSPKLIVTPNPEMIVTAQDDPELLNILNHADLKLPDGISMVVVSKIKGSPLKERVTGIDFFVEACRLAAIRGWKIYLLGGAPGIVEKVVERLLLLYPNIQIAGAHNGYFTNDDEIITRIKATSPDIVFAGLGCGRQEKWLARYLAGAGAGTGVGIGGSFDVVAGIKKRAPKWIQALYIEWLYRLITEPQRWKRQLALPKFLWLTLFR